MFHKLNFVYFILVIFITGCSTSKVSQNHGTNLMEINVSKLQVNESNKNDITSILGPPSTVSSFDQNIWIYIERKKINKSLFSLGSRKLQKNNILVVELNNEGILKNKIFYDLNSMNKLEFSEAITTSGYSKNSYMYSLLTSLRAKINNPVTRNRQK